MFLCILDNATFSLSRDAVSFLDVGMSKKINFREESLGTYIAARRRKL